MQNVDKSKTQGSLAKEIGVGRRTVAGRFPATIPPGSPDVAAQLVHALDLDPYHADVLLYSINPDWVKYGTPLKVLEASEIVRCREEDIPYEVGYAQPVPSIMQIEHEWSIVFEDNFETNHNRWGCGTKDNGYTSLERKMIDGSYLLLLDNRAATDVFMGGEFSLLRA